MNVVPLLVHYPIDDDPDRRIVAAVPVQQRDTSVSLADQAG